jgi:Ca2+:H+ antiporter
VTSLPVAIVLLLVYAAVTWKSLRRHAALHDTDAPALTGWSLRSALAVLAVATAATALVAEILVGSIEDFADRLGLTDFFVAAVIVAVVGNAAEHGGAVIVARRGKIMLAAEIATSSAAQVAVFLIPAVAVLSWAIDPLALSFRRVELLALAGSLVVAAAVLFRGRSSTLLGALLVTAYAGVVAMFFAVGNR